MNQLLWYYADLENQRCKDLKEAREMEANVTDGINLFKYEREPEGCILWRRFSKYDSLASLFIKHKVHH